MGPKSKGFTLVELLIALGLLASIGIITSRAFRDTTKKTQKLTRGIDQLNRLRSAYRVMERDFSAAFNYRDIDIFLYNEAQKERIIRYDKKIKDWADKKNKEGANPSIVSTNLTEDQRAEMEKEIGPKPINQPLKDEIIITHFIGQTDEVFLVTASGIRFREDQKVSNLMEVSYYLETCKDRKNKKKSSKCLWRGTSFNVDGDLKEGHEATVLLEGIDEFELMYLGYNQEEAEWTKSWDSLNSGNADQTNKYPAAVSLKLKVEFDLDKSGKKKKKEKLYGVFPIRFPNNDPFKNLITAVTPTSGTTTPGANSTTPTNPTTGTGTGVGP